MNQYGQIVHFHVPHTGSASHQSAVGNEKRHNSYKEGNSRENISQRHHKHKTVSRRGKWTFKDGKWIPPEPVDVDDEGLQKTSSETERVGMNKIENLNEERSSNGTYNNEGMNLATEKAQNNANMSGKLHIVVPGYRSNETCFAEKGEKKKGNIALPIIKIIKKSIVHGNLVNINLEGKIDETEKMDSAEINNNDCHNLISPNIHTAVPSIQNSCAKRSHHNKHNDNKSTSATCAISSCNIETEKFAKVKSVYGADQSCARKVATHNRKSVLKDKIQTVSDKDTSVPEKNTNESIQPADCGRLKVDAIGRKTMVPNRLEMNNSDQGANNCYLPKKRVCISDVDQNKILHVANKKKVLTTEYNSSKCEETEHHVSGNKEGEREDRTLVVRSPIKDLSIDDTAWKMKPLMDEGILKPDSKSACDRKNGNSVLPNRRSPIPELTGETVDFSSRCPISYLGRKNIKVNFKSTSNRRQTESTVPKCKDVTETSIPIEKCGDEKDEGRRSEDDEKELQKALDSLENMTSPRNDNTSCDFDPLRNIIGYSSNAAKHSELNVVSNENTEIRNADSSIPENDFHLANCSATLIQEEPVSRDPRLRGVEAKPGRTESYPEASTVETMRHSDSQIREVIEGTAGFGNGNVERVETASFQSAETNLYPIFESVPARGENRIKTELKNADGLMKQDTLNQHPLKRQTSAPNAVAQNDPKDICKKIKLSRRLSEGENPNGIPWCIYKIDKPCVREGLQRDEDRKRKRRSRELEERLIKIFGEDSLSGEDADAVMARRMRDPPLQNFHSVAPPSLFSCCDPSPSPSPSNSPSNSESESRPHDPRSRDNNCGLRKRRLSSHDDQSSSTKTCDNYNCKPREKPKKKMKYVAKQGGANNTKSNNVTVENFRRAKSTSRIELESDGGYKGHSNCPRTTISKSQNTEAPLPQRFENDAPKPINCTKDSDEIEKSTESSRRVTSALPDSSSGAFEGGWLLSRSSASSIPILDFKAIFQEVQRPNSPILGSKRNSLVRHKRKEKAKSIDSSKQNQEWSKESDSVTSATSPQVADEPQSSTDDIPHPHTNTLPDSSMEERIAYPDSSIQETNGFMEYTDCSQRDTESRNVTSTNDKIPCLVDASKNNSINLNSEFQTSEATVTTSVSSGKQNPEKETNSLEKEFVSMEPVKYYISIQESVETTQLSVSQLSPLCKDPESKTNQPLVHVEVRCIPTNKNPSFISGNFNASGILSSSLRQNTISNTQTVANLEQNVSVSSACIPTVISEFISSSSVVPTTNTNVLGASPITEGNSMSKNKDNALGILSPLLRQNTISNTQTVANLEQNAPFPSAYIPTVISEFISSSSVVPTTNTNVPGASPITEGNSMSKNKDNALGILSPLLRQNTISNTQTVANLEQNIPIPSAYIPTVISEFISSSFVVPTTNTNLLGASPITEGNSMSKNKDSLEESFVDSKNCVESNSCFRLSQKLDHDRKQSVIAESQNVCEQSLLYSGISKTTTTTPGLVTPPNSRETLKSTSQTGCTVDLKAEKPISQIHTDSRPVPPNKTVGACLSTKTINSQLNEANLQSNDQVSSNPQPITNHGQPELPEVPADPVKGLEALPRLRVRHPSELGSNWCPTPIPAISETEPADPNPNSLCSRNVESTLSALDNIFLVLLSSRRLVEREVAAKKLAIHKNRQEEILQALRDYESKFETLIESLVYLSQRINSWEKVLQFAVDGLNERTSPGIKQFTKQELSDVIEYVRLHMKQRDQVSLLDALTFISTGNCEFRPPPSYEATVSHQKPPNPINPDLAPRECNSFPLFPQTGHLIGYCHKVIYQPLRNYAPNAAAGMCHQNTRLRNILPKQNVRMPVQNQPYYSSMNSQRLIFTEAQLRQLRQQQLEYNKLLHNQTKLLLHQKKQRERQLNFCHDNTANVARKASANTKSCSLNQTQLQDLKDVEDILNTLIGSGLGTSIEKHPDLTGEQNAMFDNVDKRSAEVPSSSIEGRSNELESGRQCEAQTNKSAESKDSDVEIFASVKPNEPTTHTVQSKVIQQNELRKISDDIYTSEQQEEMRSANMDDPDVVFLTSVQPDKPVICNIDLASDDSDEFTKDEKFRDSGGGIIEQTTKPVENVTLDSDTSLENITHTDATVIKDNDGRDESNEIVPSILEVITISNEQFENLPPLNMKLSMGEEKIEGEEDGCMFCGRPSEVVCVRCVKAHYCTKACQELHWQATHHATCNPHPSHPLLSPIIPTYDV